jgi:hypothetical protein
VCHVPAGPPPSLYYLLSSGKAALSLDYAAGIPTADREAFEAALREAAFGVGVGIEEATDGDAAPVRVAVRIEAGPGDTPAGTRFVAARGRAVLRLHRARVEIEGRPAVALAPGPAARAALLDLAARVARALAD